MTVKTIILRGAKLTIGKEGIAAVAVTPGYLVERDSSNEIQPHSNAGLNAQKAFAREREVTGDDIDTDYAINDTVQYSVCPAGVEVFALVAASAAAIVVNDFVESAGDGTVRIATTDAATDDTQRAGIIGLAIEAVDNSGGGSEARIKIELL